MVNDIKKWSRYTSRWTTDSLFFGVLFVWLVLHHFLGAEPREDLPQHLPDDLDHQHGPDRAADFDLLEGAAQEEKEQVLVAPGKRSQETLSTNEVAARGLFPYR